ASDHAVRAILCALSMQRSLGEMNAARAARGEPPLRMGVGLHSGQVVLGDIGAPSRREYTAVGDTVNVAARIEELTGTHGFSVLVSDETRRLAGEAFPFEPVSPLPLRGKRESIRCWTPGWARGWCVGNTEIPDVGNDPRPVSPARGASTIAEP